jgi:hypothetical protein
MREIVEFRVDEEFASKLFGEKEGKRLGGIVGIVPNPVRQIKLAADDPRFGRVGELQREIRATTKRSFFHGWIIRRYYAPSELQQASIFSLKITSTFEPAGEECGTKYDESKACSHCGAGAKQATPLYLPENRIPKSKDFSRTIAGEIVVSRRVAELFGRHGITGVKLSPIRSNLSSSAESKDWFQFTVANASAEITAPTRVGIDIFDDDERGECRCRQGDLIGLNLLSEVSITSTSWGNGDIICSRQFVGVRRGLLRPERIILVSPKVWWLVESEKLKGVNLEVAHLK